MPPQRLAPPLLAAMLLAAVRAAAAGTVSVTVDGEPAVLGAFTAGVGTENRPLSGSAAMPLGKRELRLRRHSLPHVALT